MPVVSRGTSILVSGNWDTQTGAPTTAPGTGKYRADNWDTPTLMALNVVDANGYTRNFDDLQINDTIIQTASNDSQNYIKMTVVSVTGNVTWYQLGVHVDEKGSAFVAPGSNQRRLLQLLRNDTAVVPPPTAKSGLPPLATPDDIVDRLGRNLNQVEAARIDALLRDGSAVIRRYCRRDFVYVQGDVDIFVADAGEIRLSNKPVWSVDSVTWKSGNPALLADMPITWWVFDGIDKITIPPPYESGIINLPYMWYETAWYSDSFEVVWSHGYTDIPHEVTAVLCTAIISELSTPTMSATLASESIGAYSYSMRRTSGAGLHAALMDAGMEKSLKDLRRSQGTIAIRI